MTTTDTATYAPLWTAEDIAAYTKLSLGTVRNWAATNRLPTPIRIGRAVRWNADAVVSFFTEQAA